jgi:hypothetical protein
VHRWRRQSSEVGCEREVGCCNGDTTTGIFWQRHFGVLRRLQDGGPTLAVLPARVVLLARGGGSSRRTTMPDPLCGFFFSCVGALTRD